MYCQRAKRLLNRYIDNELDERNTLLVRQHIEGCLYCKEELQEFLSVKNLVLNKEVKKLPEDYLVYRLKKKLSVDIQRYPYRQWLRNMGSLSRRLIPVPVAIAVLSLVLLPYLSRQSTFSDSIDDYLYADISFSENADLFKEQDLSDDSIADWVFGQESGEGR